jgi:hypothetical protein
LKLKSSGPLAEVVSLLIEAKQANSAEDYIKITAKKPRIDKKEN